MSRKSYVDSIIRLEDIDPILKRFLNSHTEETKKTYGYMMKKLVEFTGGETGAQMLKDRKDWHKKIIEFHQWLKSQGYSDGYASCACAMVRGFFSYERKPLDLIRQEKLRLNTRERVDEDYFFSKEDITNMAVIGSLKEKYILLVGASFGLRAEDFAQIRYRHYRVLNLDSECPIPLGEMKTRKEKVKAYPYVSSDALPIIKAYMNGNKDKKEDEKVWNERPEQLTTVLQTLFKKSGLDAHGKIVRFHNLRKYLIDRLSAVASESQWKQIVGKKIRESPYVSTDQLRDVYARAMPSIVINGNGETKKKFNDLTQENKALRTSLTLLQTELQTVNDRLEGINKLIFNAAEFRTKDQIKKLQNVIQDVVEENTRKDYAEANEEDLNR